MRNKLIIEKDKIYTDSLKFNHNSLTEKMDHLIKEINELEIKLVENLTCPECYSLLKEEKHEKYNYYSCTKCWYDTYK